MRQNRSFFVQMDPPKGKRTSAVRPKKNRKKKKEASPEREASVFAGDRLLIFRLVVSSLLFACVQVTSLPSTVDTALLILSALIAGYDLIPKAFTSLRWGQFLAEPVLYPACTVISFLIGFGEEGAALLILLQAMKLLVAYTADRSVRSAVDRIGERGEELSDLAKEQLAEEDASILSIASSIDRTISPILSSAMVIAVVYAVILTLAMHYNIRVSVHRAITIFLVCTPFSILASMPVIGKVSLAFAAENGAVFHRAADIEYLDGTKSIFLEKSCFPGSEEAKIVSYTSVRLDDDTFFMLIRHLVRTSDQRFAKVILQQTESEFIPNLVSDFTESPGGVEATINGMHAVFGTRSYLSSTGLSAPAMQEDQGVYYYLFLDRRFGGTVILSEDGKGDIGDIVHDLRSSGINKCTLICLESAEEVSEFSQNSDFDEVFAGIDPEDRADVIDELCASTPQKKVYVRPDDALRRSTADIEIRVGESFGDSDALVFPEYYATIPMLFSLSKRIDLIALENTIIAFAFKIGLIFFSLVGYCNLWVAIMVDMLAAVVGILNANRVTTKSLIRMMLDRGK